MRKRSKGRIRSLEADYRSAVSDLKRVGGCVPDLTDTARGLKIILDEKVPGLRRSKFVTDLMTKGARITGAVGLGDKLIEGRYAAAAIGKPGDLLGVLLMYFSNEFVELERHAIETRARIMALKGNLNITEMKPVNEDHSTGPLLRSVGVDRSWTEVVERATILHRRRCIDYFAGVPPHELEQGQFATTRLSEAVLPQLAGLSAQVFPYPAEIQTFIGEVETDDRPVKKQLVAVPFKRKMNHGQTIH